MMQKTRTEENLFQLEKCQMEGVNKEAKKITYPHRQLRSIYQDVEVVRLSCKPEWS